MRKQFIEGVKTYKAAYNRAPWASRMMKVCGGFIAFESITDYETAKWQK